MLAENIKILIVSRLRRSCKNGGILAVLTGVFLCLERLIDKQPDDPCKYDHEHRRLFELSQQDHSGSK